MNDTAVPKKGNIQGPRRWWRAFYEPGMVSNASWSLRILLLLSLVLPALIAGWFSWHRHGVTLEDVHSRAQRSVVALVEHADNVLQAHSLIISEVAMLADGKTWPQIAADKRLQQALAHLTSNFAQVSVIGIADAQGRVWASNLAYPADTTIAHRDYFLAHKNGGHRGRFFGQAYTGRVSGKRQFAISIARTDANGAFDGVIFTCVPIDYFISFWRQFAPSDGYLIPLMREDGTLMVRYPALISPERLNPNGPFVTHIKQSPRGAYTAVSQVDGIERINTYSQIRDFPLYVSFSIEKRVALEQWRRDVMMAGGTAVAVSSALVVLLILVMQQSYRQKIAAQKWREVADNLEHEVARREAVEDALRHGQKMEGIGQLTGGIAHDFNNLLAGISGNLELMRIRLAQDNREAVSRHIDRAEAVVDKAASITQRLLAFSRRQPLSPTPTRVNDRIRSMLELIQRTVGPAVQMHTALPDDGWNTLCDPNQLDSALLNLAINARDAMPEGGQLTITTSNVLIDGSAEDAANGLPRGRFVTIAVADSGTGMTPEVLQRAFEPFFTTKSLGHGTGLGLSMVYGFVKQSGGEIRIASTVHAGTTVRIYLPAFDGVIPEDGGATAPPRVPRSSEAATIVLVEDEAPLRNLLSEALSDLGYQVMPAPDGASALRIIEAQEKIQLLVTDIGLPGVLNGKKLAEAARRLQGDLKVLYITGYVADARPDESFREAGTAVMTKPFKLHDFTQLVTTLVQQNT